MKQYLLICMALAFGLTAAAQTAKVTTAKMNMQYYKNGEGSNYLEKALDAINDAAVHEKTQNSGQTWYTRGTIYVAMYNDPEMKEKMADMDLLSLAFESFQKTVNLNDVKFKGSDKTNLWSYTKAVASDGFNEGVALYEAKNFPKAYERFKMTMDINKFLRDNSQQTVVPQHLAMDNASISAQNAGMHEEAIRLLRMQIDLEEDEANTYRKLSLMYEKIGEDQKALEAIEQGLERFPNDKDLMIFELNYYIQQKRVGEVLDKVKKATELDPNNDQLFFVLGNAYDNLGKIDEAEEAYAKSIEINPGNFNSVYNMAALFFNQANPIIEEMNSLGFSSADQKKYEELNDKKKMLYAKAKPFFEKAKELQPEDPNVKRALIKIESANN